MSKLVESFELSEYYGETYLNHFQCGFDLFIYHFPPNLNEMKQVNKVFFSKKPSIEDFKYLINKEMSKV